VITSLYDEDFERLLAMIDASGMLYWDVRYVGEQISPEDCPYVDDHGAFVWNVGILFADGTILRRGGGGVGGIMTPPDEQFSVLTDFIESMGAEIIVQFFA